LAGLPGPAIRGEESPKTRAVAPEIVVGHAAGEPIRLIVVGLCYKRSG